MAEFKAETVAHNWLSFRRAEWVEENIVHGAEGVMRSVCGTHLGHNMVDARGDRACIDLVCVSGRPM